jgi:hypothetical protein
MRRDVHTLCTSILEDFYSLAHFGPEDGDSIQHVTSDDHGLGPSVFTHFD